MTNEKALYSLCNACLNGGVTLSPDEFKQALESLLNSKKQVIQIASPTGSEYILISKNESFLGLTVTKKVEFL